MKKWKLVLATAAALVLAACGNGDSENTANSAEAGTEVNYVAPTEIATLDTTLLTDINSANYAGHYLEGLYWEDSQNEVQPALASEMPTVSEDGLTWTIPLREDVKWENGDAVTAHDFIFAMHRLADPNTGAAYSYLLANFENAEEVLAGDLAVEELGVKALDDYTIEIKLHTPTPYMDNLLAFSVFAPLNQKFVEAQGDAYGTSSDTILANGPYTIENWDGTGLTWTLEKNPEYYNADEIAIDTVNVQVLKEVATNTNLYEAGEVDNAILTGELVKQYAGHEDAVQHQKARTSWLQFNYNNEAFENKNLRAAIDYAIDNQALTEGVIGDGSIPISTFVPTDFIFNPEDGTDFTEEVAIDPKSDEAKATELWNQAKEELGIDSIELRLVADDDEKSKKVSQYIQGQIQNTLPGVTVEIQNVPKKNRLALEQSRDYDLILSGWGADFAHGINFFELLETGGTYNRGDYSNEEYDGYIQAAKTTHANDETATWNDFVNAQNVLSEDAAWVPLYQEVETQLRNPQIQDITLRPAGNEFDFRTASITTE